MLAFALLGIAARTLPAAVAMVKSDLAAAKSSESPHGAVVGADEVLGMAYHIGMLLAEQFAPAIAKAHGVTLTITPAPLPMPAAEQIMLTPVVGAGTARPRPVEAPPLDATPPADSQ